MTLQLLSFTEWPSTSPSDEKILIGVFGSDEYLRAFEELLQDERYRDAYAVKRVRSDISEEELQTLDAIFFGKKDPLENPRLIRRVGTSPIVLIGAHDGFLQQGGSINLIKRQRRLGFEIQLANSRRQNIEYRAKLLRLATEVYTE